MSTTRCGIQHSRDTTITNSNSASFAPRVKQIGCIIQGAIDVPRDSYLSGDVLDDQLEDQLEAKRDVGLQVKQSGSGHSVKTFCKKSSRPPYGASGSGVYSASRKLLGKLMNIPKRVAQRAAADVSNIFPDADENARPIFPGENHQLLKLKNMRVGRANYSGPGTKIVKRLKRGDPPRTLVDQVAQAHDIRYGLAQGADDVRAADKKMLRSLDRLKREGTDSKLNIAPAMLGIRSKVAAENFGLLSRTAFISGDFKPSSEDTSLMRNKLNELEQRGYGTRSSGSQNIRRFVNTSSFNPGPGTSKTQSLAFRSPMSTQTQRGVPSVDRRQNRTVAAQIASRGVNQRGMFRDGTSGVTQSGDGQNPGRASAASSAYINVQTSKNPAGNFGGNQSGGQGFGASSYGRIAGPGSSQYINVQTGAGEAATWPARESDNPGSQLLKKMQRQIKQGKRRDYHGPISSSSQNYAQNGYDPYGSRASGGKKRKKPLYWDDHTGKKKIAGMLADKMLPMIMVN